MDERTVLDLSHAVWKASPARLNFETSFGTMAWEGGPAAGDARVFLDARGTLLGWARATPGYARIRRAGVFDEAPPSLAWLLAPRAPRGETLRSIVGWAEGRCQGGFVTSHTDADGESGEVLRSLGFAPDPSEPFGIYLQQPLGDAVEARSIPDGYVLTTMAELADTDLRAEAHRVAWEGSRRTADDVRATMEQWPYRADLDVVLLTTDGRPVGSAIAWYDESYEYGELEPVGVSPDHRGRGLAAAMLRFALGRLRRAGATHALVGARGDDDYPVPRKVYASIGFEVVMTQRIVRRVE